MKIIKKALSLSSTLLILSFVGCSSSETRYMVEEKEPMGAQSEDIQKQTESKPKSEYSDEDWFYDYYDLTEEEKEKLDK